MNYRISHRTRYQYSEPVALCQNIGRLFPASDPQQECRRTQFLIEPAPAAYREYTDYFGNHVCYFDIQQPHTELTVTTISDVVRHEGIAANPGVTERWENGLRQLRRGEDETSLELRQYILPSPLVPFLPAARTYARRHFVKDRPLFECVQALMAGIYTDFTYEPGFTDLATPLDEVLDHKRGVCQDFAHVGIACLRAMGFPARYVSGYIETIPPPGEEKLQGADASHAWFSAWIPEHGWMDFDPTNNSVPAAQHVTVAHGRDYSDVAPLKGVLVGGGEHELEVAVDMRRLDDEESGTQT